MTKEEYYGAPMRKWEDGIPVGASSKPFIGGSKKKRVYKRKTKRRKNKGKKTKYTKRHSRKHRRTCKK
jgi:hypothetical protein